MSFDIFKSNVLANNAKTIGSAGSTKALADVISEELKSAGRTEVEYDVQKNLEAKAATMETKANEIMHTTNTGFGAELVNSGGVLMTDFLDLAPKMNPILSFFRGYHGRNLDLVAKRPVIGELPLHDLMPEQTTGAFALAQGK